jgi:cell wall-associated NlpC family hydrolase
MSLESYVAPMRELRAKLDGDTASGSKAADAFGKANTALTEAGGAHDGLVRTALGGWYGQQAGVFQDNVGKVKAAMTALAGNATTASTIASSATAAVTGGRTTIDGLISEFITKATPMLEAAETAAAHGDTGRALQAHGQVQLLADEYTTKTGDALRKIRDQLTPLVGQLGAMTKVDAGAMSGVGGQLGPAMNVQSTAASAAVGDGGSGNGHGAQNLGSGSHSGGGGGHGGGGGGGGGGGSATAVGPHLPTAIPPQPGSGVGVNLPDGSSAEAPNETAAQAVRNAMTALGTPYVWGASNPPAGTDCSGLTSWAYGNAGMPLPRHSSDQAMGSSVPDASQTLPGDLVVWGGHVAMVVGNGQMIEAGDPVQVSHIRTSNIGMPFLGFYRPTG